MKWKSIHYTVLVSRYETKTFMYKINNQTQCNVPLNVLLRIIYNSNIIKQARKCENFLTIFLQSKTKSLKNRHHKGGKKPIKSHKRSDLSLNFDILSTNVLIFVGYFSGFLFLISGSGSDLNGSVGSISDLKSKGPG
jgi:hypothetical protein